MRVGCFGKVVFNVSGDQVKTIRDVEMSHSASLSIHKIHLGIDRVEFTGSEPMQLSFKILLSAYLGVNVESELEMLRTYLENGEAHPFVLGNRLLGRDRFIIESMKVSGKMFNKNGDITQCDVALSMREYYAR